MARKPVTKGSPRPDIKDYKGLPNGQALFEADVAKWQELNVGKPTVSSPTTQPGGAVVPTGPIESTTRVQSGKVRTDWESFTDGSFNLQEGDALVGQTPYVTAVIPGKGEAQTPAVILPSPDGKGFLVIPREELLQQIAIDIKKSPNNISYWKTQLQNYYRSQAAFETSLRGGPVTDKDTEFIFALRRALSEISTDNFNAGVNNVRNNQLNTSGFYDVNSWITRRTPIPGTTRQGATDSSLTKRADAIADFMREVQIQVGDPKLVNNVDALAEAYWQKIKKVEENRSRTSVSYTDPITGNTEYTGKSYQMPSAQLLKEWRVEFITKGAIDKDKVISTGIRNVAPIDLQDAGGEIGDNYTKLKGYAFEYGVKLSDEDLKKKAAEATLPGGSIEEQQRSIQLASRALYKPLAPYIEGGLKVKDIASQFMKAKANELELSDGEVDIFDPDVQAAISGDKLPGSLDYLMQIRSDPRYRFTKKANEGAAGFLDTLLRMWGKVG
jgi:hypothetical protein